MQEQEIKKTVRERYAGTAKGDNSCCAPSCCGGQAADAISKTVGYTDEDIQSVPEGANLGLGCGNPVAIAGLKRGETYLDLGSGASPERPPAWRVAGYRWVVSVPEYRPSIDRW